MLLGDTNPVVYTRCRYLVADGRCQARSPWRTVQHDSGAENKPDKTVGEDAGQAAISSVQGQCHMTFSLEYMIVTGFFSHDRHMTVLCCIHNPSKGIVKWNSFVETIFAINHLIKHSPCCIFFDRTSTFVWYNHIEVLIFFSKLATKNVAIAKILFYSIVNNNMFCFLRVSTSSWITYITYSYISIAAWLYWFWVLRNDSGRNDNKIDEQYKRR